MVRIEDYDVPITVAGKIISSSKFDLEEIREIADYLLVHYAIHKHFGVSINNTISIPDNVTNGDMLKIMFPNMYVEECDYDVFTDLDGDSRFTYDWWNAPYKKMEDEK